MIFDPGGCLVTGCYGQHELCALPFARRSSSILTQNLDHYLRVGPVDSGYSVVWIFLENSAPPMVYPVLINSLAKADLRVTVSPT